MGGVRLRYQAGPDRAHAHPVALDPRLDVRFAGPHTAMPTGIRSGAPAAPSPAPVAVPAGSQLVIRSTGNVHLEVTRKGGLEDVKDADKTPLPAGTEEHRLTIKGDGSASIHGVLGSDRVWAFTAIPDTPPTIECTR